MCHFHYSVNSCFPKIIFYCWNNTAINDYLSVQKIESSSLRKKMHFVAFVSQRCGDLLKIQIIIKRFRHKNQGRIPDISFFLSLVCGRKSFCMNSFS